MAGLPIGLSSFSSVCLHCAQEMQLLYPLVTILPVSFSFPTSFYFAADTPGREADQGGPRSGPLGLLSLRTHLPPGLAPPSQPASGAGDDCAWQSVCRAQLAAVSRH